MEKKIKINYMTIWQALTLVALMLIVGICSGLLFNVIFDNEILKITITYTTVMLSAIAWCQYRKNVLVPNYHKDYNRVIKFGGVNFTLSIVALLIILITGIVFDPYLNLMSEELKQEYLAMFEHKELFFMTVLIAPVVEEVIFRGYVFNGMAMRYGLRPAIIYSSLIFALIHFSLIQSPTTFVISLIITIAYIKSGYRLSTAIFIHFVNNLIAFIITYYLEDFVFVEIREIIQNDIIFFPLYFGSTIIVLGYLFLTIKRIK